MSDFYKILEVEKTATQDEIKRAYRRLSKKYHPDKEGGNAEKFKELNVANQTLSDETKRYAYDRGIEPRPIPKVQVNDIHLSIAWTLQHIKNGYNGSIGFQRAVVCTDCLGVGSKDSSAITKCPHCGGIGRSYQKQMTPFGVMEQEFMCGNCRGTGEHNANPCPTCHGEKQIAENAKEQINIPPHTIRHVIIPEKGHKIIHGTSHLIVHLTFQETSDTYLQENNLHKTMTIDFYDALLGKSTEFLMGTDKLKIVIPKESKQGKLLRLAKGYCGLDVIVHLNIPFPSIADTDKFIQGLFKDSDISEQTKEILKSKLV